MNIIPVAIPCRAFTVSFHLGSGEGLSPVEQFALRAIAAGAQDVTRMREALNLHPRVAVDLCVDLLRAGHIRLDRETGTLSLADNVHQAMGDPASPAQDWAQRLSTARPPESREVTLYQELISGAIFSQPFGGMGGPFKLVAPENERVPEVSDIPKARLMSVVAGALRSRYSRGEAQDKLSNAEELMASSILGQRVTDVTVRGESPEEGAHENTRQVRLVIQLRALRGTDPDCPDFQVVGPAALPLSVRRSIASGLRHLWDRGVARSDMQFFQRLPFETDAADVSQPLSLLEPAHQFEAMARLAARLEEAEHLVPEEASKLHEDLTDSEREASEQVHQALTYATSTKLLVSIAEQDKLILRALNEEAETQVVLVCPWTRRLEREELQLAIVNAVSRGVRVHLLWGLEHNRQEPLPQGIQQLLTLTAPSENRTGGLFVSERPAAVHAKLVICDMRWALVTSWNFLNSEPTRRQHEIGVLVNAPEVRLPTVPETDGRPPAPQLVAALLAWVRGLIPDFRLQRVLSDDPTLFGCRPTVAPVNIGREISPPRDTEASRRIWHAEWDRRVQSLRKELEQVRDVATPVSDAEHRMLLVKALESAKERLLISSEVLGVGVLGQVPMRSLREAVRRGVKVTLIFRDERDPTGELGPRRAELESLGVRLLVRDIHAKVLVCDDWAVVSSFNFLSFEGYYGSSGRARHELGVRLLERQMADRLSEAVEAAPHKDEAQGGVQRITTAGATGRVVRQPDLG